VKPVVEAPAQDARPLSCLHCQLPLANGQAGAFCCRGCEAVYALLHDGELDRYYSLRRGSGRPISDVPSPTRDLEWLEEARQSDSNATRSHISLDIQGIHCSGCVWVVEKLFRRSTGALKIEVNPTLGKIDIWVTSEFPLEEWIRVIETFGYRLGPSLKRTDSAASALLIRVGVTVAIALNVMMLSVAMYLGLNDGPLYEVFRAVSYALASLSVIVGAPVFLRSALVGIRNGVLHLDVPISLGITLAFAGSSWAFWSGHDTSLYLDSVSVFIALMLVGRYLQERVLNTNKSLLLASDGTNGLRSKRIDTDNIQTTIKSNEIMSGDRLFVAPGDLVPVTAKLCSEEALVSTDWINGESEATLQVAGTLLQAGSFNGGNQACIVEATSDFEQSPLRALLQPSHRAEAPAHEYGSIQRLSRYYVAGILLAATLGFVGWLVATGSILHALEVATAVLVVSCPCAFGIATPLAHELVQAHLQTRGFYIRRSGFLARLRNIRTIVFDKTGTLTCGQLTLQNKDSLSSLSEQELRVLVTLASHSSHPVSAAIALALKEHTVLPLPSMCIVEHPGKGIEGRGQEHLYRLGKARWALEEASVLGTVFTKDGQVIANLALGEALRPDAQREISALVDEGYNVYMLSGDTPDRVAILADELGLPRDHALSEQSPGDKQRWLEARNQTDALFIGDGINDSLAAQTASCSGTPAIDRPFMASHCDFYLGTQYLAPIRDALHAANALHRVVRRNLVFAILYNILAIALAWAGLMRPWLAAILMPASSILIVLATTLSLAPRTSKWKS